ncbi:putative fatty-acyl-CoA synthase system [Microsporum audouinii]
MSDLVNDQRKLAHTLLVELMAYQFASPVRWIETQDVILAENACSRIIEIGPTNTLVGMFQRTINSLYQTQECILPMQRQLLNSERDTKKVYYEATTDVAIPMDEFKEREGRVELKAANTGSGVVPVAAKSPVDEFAIQPARSIGAEADIDDRPVKAQEILIAIVSKTLKKALPDIDVSKSLKMLAGGRSTLENEIVGDLSVEFGSLPDRVEDLPLAELWDTVQLSHKGALGKISTGMINSMFTAKMPGSFTTAVARERLQTQWQLQQGRQDSCLILATTIQPATRMTAQSEAAKFIDLVVEKYSLREGIVLGRGTSASDQPTPGTIMVDAEAVRALSESQHVLSKKLLKAYASHLELEYDPERQILGSSQEGAAAKLQTELDLWIAEHGQEYADGIHPIFDTRKVRTYNSSWAWARQSLIELFIFASATERRDVHLDPDMVSKTCHFIANAAEENIIPIIQEMKTKFHSHPLLEPIFCELERACRTRLHSGPVYQGTPKNLGPCTTISPEGNLRYVENERKESIRFADLTIPTTYVAEPYLHLKEKLPQGWMYSRKLTSHLYAAFDQVEKQGESFSDQTVLITGAGIGSIGASMICHFLQGGARVLTTTSSFSPETARKYQSIYTEHGARGSQLIVIPFNQASTQDVISLVEYIYDAKGLGLDIDYLVPFAAISESRKLDTIGSKSELAHRIMLTNVLRLLGAVKSTKEKYGYLSHPAQVILPLSPNHGIFGGDGLYGESKIALETLFNRWHSEDWQDYLSICGAVIGWTRGTGLMNQNDLVAEGIEAAGMRTFSQEEMAYALVCLCIPTINTICQEQPIYADLTGGMGRVKDLPGKLHSLRYQLNDRSDLQSALFAELKFEQQCNIPTSLTSPTEIRAHKLDQRAHVRPDFPKVLQYDKDIAPLGLDLYEMVDLQRVVVITGFSELGPHGNSRTRWEMEAYGQFSLEGAVEMAWLMGLIRYTTRNINGKPYSGWIDSKSKEPVAELKVKEIYEEQILAHSGIRIIEPELCDGYNPNKKQFLHEVILQEDLEPLYVPESLAEQMRLEHGDFATVGKSSKPDIYCVRLHKGAKLFIPRAMKFSHTVAGLIPTGWDARTYGIPEEIITQVDRVTLFTLVCAIEALISSGISDPYELYQYIHISEVATCIGSGIGGVSSLGKMFNGRSIDKDVQKDILQETFINTIGAWVNMLLLSASGPIRTPVGACATAVESLELGHDTITSGKAKFCLVGGCDDFSGETSYEFANMKATSNATEEFIRGREPKEMSRPATSTRNGFVESQGCGLQVLTTAELALKMGLPIRGIVAFVGTSSDKAGRSLPAPGKGILTNVKHATSNVASTLPNVGGRRKRLDIRRQQIALSRDASLAELESELLAAVTQDPSTDANIYLQERQRHILAEFQRETSEAQYALGNNFWRNDPYIAPIAGALATWGLTIDDLGVASFHGTSTVLNDKNESGVIQKQLLSLGRRRGNPILSVFQKYLTGHSKGAAGAWMLNGALQMLDSGLVPGNRNADNIDPALKEFDLIVYLQRSIQVDEIKAVSITSFGFGQKGAQAICVHPKYLFATIGRETYENYLGRRMARQRKADAYFYQGMNSNTLFKAKSAPPFPVSKEEDTYLDPEARFP